MKGTTRPRFRLLFVFLALSFFAVLLLLFADFRVDFVLDLLQLLLGLLVGVGKNQQALTLVLQLACVVISLGLQAHWLSLVKALSGSHKFVV